MLFVNPFEVIKKTEDMYYIKPGSIISKKRTQLISEARAVSQYIVRKTTPYSWEDIADHYDKDHTSIISNCKKIEKIVQQGSNLRVNKAILILREAFKVDEYEKGNTDSIF